MKQIAVIEAGYWRKNIVRNYREWGMLHSICDSSTEVLACLLQRYPPQIHPYLDAPDHDRIIESVTSAHDTASNG